MKRLVSLTGTGAALLLAAASACSGETADDIGSGGSSHLATGGATANTGGAASMTGGVTSAAGGAAGHAGATATGGGATVGGAGAGGLAASSGGNPGFVGQIRFVFLHNDRCSPAPIPHDSDGHLSCRVFELPSFLTCDCTQAGRAPVSAVDMGRLREALREDGACGFEGSIPCEDYCACQVPEAAGEPADVDSALWSCQNEVTPNPELTGVCLVDAETEPPLGNPDVISENCDEGERRLLRPIGSTLPAENQLYYLDCPPE